MQSNIVSPLKFTFSKTITQEVKIFAGEYRKFIESVIESINPDKVFLVCDEHINKLHADPVIGIIEKDWPVHKIVHSADEVHKNWSEAGKIATEFFNNNGTSKSCIIALGGGLTGNMAGLFASLGYRGLPLVHIPTTLLAQVDSAADVKQSINAEHAKNTIGSYKAPTAVIIDPSFLQTLSDRELRAGFGEAIKHAFAQDIKFADFIVSHKDSRNDSDLLYIASHAITLKIQHWKNTPTIWNDKTKVERLTHLGHTVGKILEMIDVDHLSHGEAIAHGMIIEAYISHLMGNLGLDAVEKIHDSLKELILLYPLTERYTPEGIVEALYRNNQKPLCALLRELGNPDTISVAPDRSTVEKALTWYFDTYSPRSQAH